MATSHNVLKAPWLLPYYDRRDEPNNDYAMLQGRATYEFNKVKYGMLAACGVYHRILSNHPG